MICTAAVIKMNDDTIWISVKIENYLEDKKKLPPFTFPPDTK